jgi:hypothetical protein
MAAEATSSHQAGPHPEGEDSSGFSGRCRTTLRIAVLKIVRLEFAPRSGRSGISDICDKAGASRVVKNRRQERGESECTVGEPGFTSIRSAPCPQQSHRQAFEREIFPIAFNADRIEIGIFRE